MKKPPYTRFAKGHWYWEPRGWVAERSVPEGLGVDPAKAFARGWQLYNEARADKPKARALKQYSVSWGVGEWRKSDDYSRKANGKPKSPHTIRGQETNLRVIETETRENIVFGTTDLRSFRKAHAKKWYIDLREERGFSMGASVMRTLRQLFGFFIDEGWYPGDTNPAAGLRLHVPESTYTPWTWPRIKAFTEQAVRDGRPSAALGVCLIYDTSQNPQDVLRFKWDQYNGEGIRHKRGKTDVRAYVPLTEFTRALLGETQRNAVQMVVYEETGRPYTPRLFALKVREICEAAGLPDELKAGNLRHEAAQEAQDAGAADEDIQALLGHGSKATQRFYTRPMDATRAQEARERMRKEREDDA